MKKIISLMLVIVFMCTLVACGSKNTSSNIDTSTPTQNETFIKPENYTSVLLVSINPQFKLYLDENNNVLSIEPVNEDAKSFFNSIDFENKSIETVIGNIVEQANNNGFIKENVSVNFEITEQKDGISGNNILSKVVLAANQKATELNIEIKTQIKENNKSQTTETNSENSKPTTSSQPKETTKKEESSSKPTTTTKPTESKPTHTHEFSSATCTLPQKCSCGETKGSALGHKWQDATCKAAKTCSVCKITDGNIGNHKYTDGKCIYCSDKQIISPKTGLKTNGNYYKVSNDGDENYTLIIYTFKNSSVGVNGVYSTNEEWKENEAGDPITYKGKTYYPGGFGGPMPEYTLTDTEIIVKYSEPEFANIEYRLIINYEYDLEVTYSSDGGMFKKGDVLDLVG